MDVRYKGLDDLGEDQGARRRKPTNVDRSEEGEGLYNELQRLRGLVDVIEGGDKKGSSFFRISLDNSMMSTIFGLVFLVICSVTIYAFYNLFRAISRRFFQEL